jgi:hypothetical protein
VNAGRLPFFGNVRKSLRRIVFGVSFLNSPCLNAHLWIFRANPRNTFEVRLCPSVTIYTLGYSGRCARTTTISKEHHMSKGMPVATETEWQTQMWIRRHLQVGPYSLQRLVVMGKVRARMPEPNELHPPRGGLAGMRYAVADVLASYVRGCGREPADVPDWQRRNMARAGEQN